MKTATVYRMGAFSTPSRFTPGSPGLKHSQAFDKVRPRGSDGRRVQGRVGALYASPSPEGVATWAMNYLNEALLPGEYFAAKRRQRPSQGRLEGFSFAPQLWRLTVPATVQVYSINSFEHWDAEGYWAGGLPVLEWQAAVARGENPHHLEYWAPELEDETYCPLPVHYAECLLRPEEVLRRERLPLHALRPHLVGAQATHYDHLVEQSPAVACF